MIKTYELNVCEPIYYSSKEGRSIYTNKRLSATALMHAIGYKYFNLNNKYVMFGEESKKPDYSHLKNVPFTTDVEPIDVDVDSYEFKSVCYPEHNIITEDDNLSKKLFNESKSYPRKLAHTGSSWHRLRNYIGISIGSKLRFTVWDENDIIPDNIRFRMGIGKSGFLVGERKNNISEKVTINKFLLNELYDINEKQTIKIMKNSKKYIKGNDPRLHHYIDVDRKLITNIINK